MRTFDATNAQCHVLTYKAGLLAAVGHDLALQVNTFTLTIDDDDTIRGTFDASSMSVLGAVKDGEVVEGVLSEKDKSEVLTNIEKYVLHQHEGANIRFESDEVFIDDDSIEGDGTLHIPPRQYDIDFEVAIDEGTAVCELVLHQPNWGITPFSALMGALRIQPDIRIRITVPWDE